MLLGSKIHTAGDTRRWVINYDRWLDNTAEIDTVTVTSSSITCTVNQSKVLGREVEFFVNGGVAGEQLTVTIVMTDTFNNIKTDTLAFTVIAP